MGKRDQVILFIFPVSFSFLVDQVDDRSLTIFIDLLAKVKKTVELIKSIISD